LKFTCSNIVLFKCCVLKELSEHLVVEIKKKLHIDIRAHGWFRGKLAWSVDVAEVNENKL
jgi:hypothetical protein